MSVAELEETEVLEEEVLEIEEVDEEVDNDQIEETEANAEEVDGGEVEQSADEPEDDSDEMEVTFEGESLTPVEDEEEEKGAPQWAKDLRKMHKETSKENRELKKKLTEMEQSSQTAETDDVKPRSKPTLEDFDYDQDAYEVAYQEWFSDNQKVEAKKAEMQKEQERQAQEWQEKLDSFEASKKKLKVKDYEDAEEYVLSNFDQTQQGIIVQGSDNPALSIYAIGKNSKVAKELANIKDPVKFAFAVAKMESKLKYSKKKARTNPEGSLKSSGTGGTSVDNTLARLEKEAEKTNDRSKIVAYKRKLRAQK